MLELVDITKVYRGGKRAVDGMTLSEGERTALDAGATRSSSFASEAFGVSIRE
ncbi:hypothetical protein [Streptomyces sp. NPDC088726]|uniref:hypothetical protein n=1 Tax=Streptomyces sp. NPDC088726 TaxID=3365874 RepID=UPI003806DDFA